MRRMTFTSKEDHKGALHRQPASEVLPGLRPQYLFSQLLIKDCARLSPHLTINHVVQ